MIWRSSSAPFSIRNFSPESPLSPVPLPTSRLCSPMLPSCALLWHWDISLASYHVSPLTAVSPTLINTIHKNV